MFESSLRTPGAAASAPVVALRDVRKVYGRGEGAVVALDGVSVTLAAGQAPRLAGRGHDVGRDRRLPLPRVAVRGPGAPGELFQQAGLVLRSGANGRR